MAEAITPSTSIALPARHDGSTVEADSEREATVASGTGPAAPPAEQRRNGLRSDAVRIPDDLEQLVVAGVHTGESGRCQWREIGARLTPVPGERKQCERPAEKSPISATRGLGK